jgi:acyl carrier protein
MEELDRDEVTRRVRELLAEALHRNVDDIGVDDRLVEDLGAASVDLITLVFELEDAFGRTFEDEDIRGLTTVRSVVDFILAAKAEGVDV